jgi:hypothetical protein
MYEFVLLFLLNIFWRTSEVVYIIQQDCFSGGSGVVEATLNRIHVLFYYIKCFIYFYFLK